MATYKTKLGKYRIVKITLNNGDEIYAIEEKIFWCWHELLVAKTLDKVKDKLARWMKVDQDIFGRMIKEKKVL
jgi:sulfur transfer complex TusBCD TusB component (DsrH family)